MKIFPCLDIANGCGLNHTDEAFINIDYHAINTFPYEKVNEEMNELLDEYLKYGFAEKVIDNNNNNKIVLKKNICLAAALDIVNCYNGTNLIFSDFEC